MHQQPQTHPIHHRLHQVATRTMQMKIKWIQMRETNQLIPQEMMNRTKKRRTEMKKSIRKNRAIAITKKIKKGETAETNKEPGQLMFFVPGKTLVYDVKLPTPKEIKPNLKIKPKIENLMPKKQKIK